MSFLNKIVDFFKPLCPAQYLMEHDLNKVIFTEEEFEEAQKEIDELSEQLADAKMFAVKLRAAGKFKKADQELLDEFDKFINS